jgi:hypothetical protein
MLQPTSGNYITNYLIRFVNLHKMLFEFFSIDPSHPALSMERLRCVSNYWSVRITRSYRAVGVKAGNDMTWFWIGSHTDFEKKFPV